MQNILLIVNPYSGKGQSEKYAQDLKEILIKKHQADVSINLIGKSQSPFELGKTAVSRGFDTVISLGGDGTVNQVISGLLENEVKPNFSFIPLGTVNDLGRALGMSMNPELVIREFDDFHEQLIDIGQINDKYFINVVAIGTIPESVMETSHIEKNKFGKFAYLKDGLMAAFSDKSYTFKIICENDEVHEINSNLILIGLTNSIGGYEQMNQTALVDDGLVYLSAVVGNNLFDMSTALLEGKMLDKKTDKLFTYSGKKIRIEAEGFEILTCNIDGDPGMTLPVDISVLPKVLNCIVPGPKV